MDKKKKRSLIDATKIKGKNHKLVMHIYKCLCSMPGLNKYIYNIKLQFEMLLPGNNYRIVSRSLMLLLFINVASYGLIFLCSLLYELSLIVFLIMAVLVFVLQHQVIMYFINQTMYMMLGLISDFLKKVAHNYASTQRVDDAVFLSMNDLSEEMKDHAKIIHDILCSNNIATSIDNYIDTMHNVYLKQFLSFASKVIEYGDQIVDNHSLFLMNIENLCTEIEIERLKQEKLKFGFRFKIFTCIIPLVFLDVIKKFCISIAEKSTQFYFGRGSMITEIIIVVVAIVCYLLIVRLKEYKSFLPVTHTFLASIEKNKLFNKLLTNYMDKHSDKQKKLQLKLNDISETISPAQFFIKQCLIAVIFFIVSLSIFELIHIKNKSNSINQVTVQTMTSAITEMQYEDVKDIIREYCNLYKNEDVTEEQIYQEVKKKGMFYNDLINESISKDIIKRIHTFKNEYFKYYELLIAIALMLIGYYVPYIEMFYKKKLMQSVKNDEVNQFEAIINMLKYSDHVTVKDILQEIERFSYAFRQPIRTCINEYNNGSIKALEKLKDSTSHLQFRYLVDNLIHCDSKPLKDAFEYSLTNKSNYFERRRQENEISINKRVDIGTLISLVPLFLVGCYSLIPILLYSLNDLKILLQELEGFGG